MPGTLRRPAPPRAAALALLLAALPALVHPAQAAPTAQRTRATLSRAAPAPQPYGRRDDVRQVAASLAAERALDPAWVEEVLAEARHVPSVARLIQPPPSGTAKNWAAYRARFVEPVRIRAGVAFWEENEHWLREAEARFGVPPEIVVGIVGVETLYGRHMGDFRVLDALATLALDFPAAAPRDRSAFFRDELGSFLVLCRSRHIDPLAPTGSYAGASGMPQFMPSSILRYAVDFDADGRIDLQGSPADVIGSVANYLAEFGWQRGQPTHYPVDVPLEAADRAVLLAPDILPSFSAMQFTERGAALDDAGRRHEGLLALVELQNGDGAPSYVAGTQNFYAITRYNWSSYYALAVIELGRAVGDVVAAVR